MRRRIGNPVSTRVHLRARRLHLGEPKLGKLLHGQVDLRGRNGALTTEGRRVGDTENHESYEGLKRYVETGERPPSKRRG